MFTSLSAEQLAQRNKIYREYNMLRGDKIVLTNDFFACAVNPALEEGSVLQAIYGEQAQKILQRLQALTVVKGRPLFGVPYVHLTEGGKARQVNFIKTQVDEQMRIMEEDATKQAQMIAARFGQPSDKAILIKGDRMEDIAEQMKENPDGALFISLPDLEYMRPSIEWQVKNNSVFIGVYLADIIQEMREVKLPLGRDGVTRFEQDSIRKGEGQTVLKFWQAVNALDDYSDLFPNYPDLPSKRKKPTEEKKNPFWDWVPGAAKPA